MLNVKGNAVGPPCSQFPHPWIQPTCGSKLLGKKKFFLKVPKGRLEFATHQQLFT